MRPLSLALRLVLALCVALVSVHTAIGRAEAAGASDIQFCVGAEVVTLTVNANGEPIQRHHSCPDCVLSGLALLAETAAPMPPVASTLAQNQPSVTRSVTSAPVPRKSARGPPALTQA